MNHAAQCFSLVLPPAEAGPGPAPLLILLHGVGGNETSMMGLARALDPRFLRLVLRGPLAFGPEAYGWFHVDFTPAGPMHQVAEAEASRRMLADWIPGAVRQHGADPRRVYVLGFSQGAIMAMSLLLTRPDLVAGAVAWSGRILAETIPDGQAAATLHRRDALVIHGRYDRTLPVHHGQASRDRLQTLGLRSVDYREPASGHEVTEEVLELTNAWLARELARNPA
jgi:phospholipase/carboxylesterase